MTEIIHVEDLGREEWVFRSNLKADEPKGSAAFVFSELENERTKFYLASTSLKS